MGTRESYLEQVTEDLREALDDDNGYVFSNQEVWDMTDGGDDPYQLVDALHDWAWTHDGITGNGSGSYFFSSAHAREFVLDHLDEVREAYTELCGDLSQLGEDFVNEEWETMDVTARCHFLYPACDEVANEVCDYLREHRDQLIASGEVEENGEGC